MTRMLAAPLEMEPWPEPEGPLPFISVIVPVRNEAAFIRDTLTKLLTQNYDPGRFEVLVADGESTDATPDIVLELATRHDNLRLLHNPKRWSSAGRNVGVRAARGSLIVIVDGHCDLENRNYLLDVAESFAGSGADCLGRPQPLDVSRATPLQRAIAAARASRLGHHPDSFIYSSEESFVSPQSVAVAYRRQVFETVGLFDENFDACEDVEFNHRVDRAGLRCFFTPKVAARYHPRSSLKGLFKQMVRYGRGRVRLLRKHPETFTAPCFVPAAFVVGLGLGPLFALMIPWLGLVYAGAVGLYLAAVLVASLTICLQQRSLRLLAWLPLAFFTIHTGAGTGLLQELAVGLWPRREERGAIVLQEQPH